MNDNISISELIVLDSEPLQIAMECIDKHGLGIAFCVNQFGKLSGVITDGNVRRAFIAGFSKETLIHEVATKDFVFCKDSAPREEILAKLSTKIKIIPLVNNEFEPVDFASLFKVKRYPIMEPQLKGNELDYVTECIKTNWISSQGKYVTEFENLFSDYLHMPYAMAVSNGTVALHLTLVTLGVGEGDEVIVPDLTFAASINAILHAGATPVIVDVDRNTWNIDPDKVRSAINEKTKAIMPVHLYGNPCDMMTVMEIANEHDLLVLEDSAEALGSEINGRKAGTYGDAAAFSFFGNKTITTGEGGMIVFKSESAFEKAKVLRDHGMSKTKRYWHDHVGFNYRMTNIQAAIGVAQMERIDQIIQRKISIGRQYDSLLKSSDTIQFQNSLTNCQSSYWLYSLMLNAHVDAAQVRKTLSEKGIESRRIFYPLSEMDIYQEFATQPLLNSKTISQHGLSLPSYLNLTADDVGLIANELLKVLH